MRGAPGETWSAAERFFGVLSRGHRSGRRLAGLAETPGLHCRVRGAKPNTGRLVIVSPIPA